MILAARRRHCIAWLALAALLPLVLWFAWTARPEPALMDRLPATLLSEKRP